MQCDFTFEVLAEILGRNSASSVHRTFAQGTLKEKDAKEICNNIDNVLAASSFNVKSKVRYQWLMGYDDFMTEYDYERFTESTISFDIGFVVLKITLEKIGYSVHENEEGFVITGKDNKIYLMTRKEYNKIIKMGEHYFTYLVNSFLDNSIKGI